MWKTRLPLLLAASLAVATPVNAEPDFGKIVSGIAQSLINQELDRTAFVEAQRLNTVSAYRNYLTKFPKGAFRVNAEQALAKLGVPVNPLPTGGGYHSAASIEASIGLSRTQRIQIQKQLTAIGYATGVADDLWGTNTRSAIFRWQTANKLAATGYITAQQVNLIAQQAGPGIGTDPVGPVAGNDAVEERLLGLTYAERREVQSRLTSLGYNTGGVDGVFGANTRRALASWQRDEAVRVSGYLTADQLRALRSETGG
ncbi:peptidoglycan-binding protein [Devosia sp.]|uniref:peptidoglycan-binding domain-containing protein n=1 Tax=Devosia sp. TaxID=1871048 RepID=UPI0027341769|nr:peptidoglycan-binding protein [Devosia sp.]MDP2779748.1 peptidoglycan-binding domain-containing protein [Devosia sp.]